MSLWLSTLTSTSLSPVTSSSKEKALPLTAYAVCLSNLHPVIIRPQVEYVLEEFHFRIPQEAFKFLFQLYNFVSRMKTVASQNKPAHNHMAFEAMLTKDLQSFTTDGSNDDDGGGTWTFIKRQHRGDQAWDQPYGNDDDDSDEDDGGGTWTTLPKRQHQGDRAWDQPYVSDALAEKGYYIELEEEIEGWTPRHPVRHLSVNEILIDIEELIR
jgi:hypothetical protein